jgi:hypothetical protein
MAKNPTARELLDKIEKAEMRDYSEEVRDEAQTLLLSRHLALLTAMRRAGPRTPKEARPRA